MTVRLLVYGWLRNPFLRFLLLGRRTFAEPIRPGLNKLRVLSLSLDDVDRLDRFEQRLGYGREVIYVDGRAYDIYAEVPLDRRTVR